MTVTERFWNKVDRLSMGDCWTWTASVDSSGYGLFRVKNKVFKAHRFAYVLAGNNVDDSLCVLHRCDNRRCVRPDHMFVGTRADNNRDRDKKGRHIEFHGIQHPMHKLEEFDVLTIRGTDVSMRGTKQILAIKYQVSPSTIGKILSRKTWRHI